MTTETQEERTGMMVCRTCLNECTEFKSIHKQGIIFDEVRTLASMLSYLTNLEFPREEDLSPHICKQCFQDLAGAYKFKRMVLHNDEILRRPLLDIAGDVKGECGGGSSIEDVDTESAGSFAEEHHLEGEEVEISVEDEGHIHELATAAQFKRSVEGVEYVSLTVLDEGNGVQEQNSSVQELVENDVEVKQENEIQESVNLLTKDSDSEESRNNLKRHISIEDELETQHDVKQQPYKIRRKNTEPKASNPALQCKVCGKQLSTQNSFKYHMQLHSDATPFLCSLCGEGFKTRNAYEGHIIIHDPNNPNTCELCGKSYRQSSSLRTHMMTHTGERPFQCDICGKSMTQKSGYKKHMLVHTGEKPHTCDVCGREFRYSSNLIAHKRCHSGEKPYNCSQCNRSFPTSEQAKRHALVHTGEKPFECDICKKRFKRRSSLISHRNTHNYEQEIIVDHKVSKSRVVELF